VGENLNVKPGDCGFLKKLEEALGVGCTLWRRGAHGRGWAGMKVVVSLLLDNGFQPIANSRAASPHVCRQRLNRSVVRGKKKRTEPFRWNWASFPR
jgi:hypothetical protein